MDTKQEKRIAVLIDAENVSSKYIKLILDETSNYGTATYKRLYGDFQIASVKTWMKNMQEYAITPVFQYNYTHGKNASDSALIIDAMDILYSGNVDGFCIVTSDSDFTKLVLRLRESGMTVIGMGEQKTPTALVSACETFKFLDILYDEENGKAQRSRKKKNSQAQANASANQKKSAQEAEAAAAAEAEAAAAQEAEEESIRNIPDMAEMEKEVIAIIEAAAGDDGWADLSVLGDNLPKRVPGFDPRNYGCSKLRLFIEKFDSIESKPAHNPHNPLLSVIYVRVKPQEEAESEPEPAKKSRRRGGRRKKGEGGENAGTMAVPSTVDPTGEITESTGEAKKFADGVMSAEESLSDRLRGMEKPAQDAPETTTLALPPEFYEHSESFADGEPQDFFSGWMRRLTGSKKE